MIASGGLSGGISSTIAGGDFWQGMRQGLITSGLNHVLHMGADGLEQDKPKGRNSEGKLYGGDGSGDALDLTYRVVDNINDWLPTKSGLDLVYGLFTGADLNGNPMSGVDFSWAVIGVIPVNKFSTPVKGATGWVKRSVYKSYDKTVQKDISRAIAKGVVPPKGHSGII
ncbi:hypothetical protein [Myroides sp. DF42-4-2]|uniref:hypothetical protein n=1 Tax=unclassified Myroides TaxID=2642485 RepID=UPI0025760A1E|nr:hypothetical protein [Myroides sp. DF42-4-2]MDM1408104.1 hypothetical protein [Myroides sp. DF42-4-2]